MGDRDDVDHQSPVVDLIEHAVLATPCGPKRSQWLAEWLPHSVGILAQRTENELESGRCNTLGKLVR